MIALFQELQNSTASEGQVVVLECRERGPPPIHVKWFRQGIEIQDSPDFRILQKSKAMTEEATFDMGHLGEGGIIMKFILDRVHSSSPFSDYNG